MSRAAGLLSAFTLLAGACCPAATTPAGGMPSGTEASTAAKPAATEATGATPIDERAVALGRGINLGNALEAPREGEWGVTLRDEDFTLVADAGFDHVRIPIRWSAHALDDAPYTIDPAFFERVDWAVDAASKAGLRAVVNVHHYDGIAQEPDAHRARFIGLWKQISEHYSAYPDTLYFELLNEPHGALIAQKNNALIAETLRVVRQTNPTRAVIVGSVEWGSFRGLPALELPTDEHLIVTFHYYDPFDFTHQGAPWVNKEDQIGIDWPGPVGTEQNIRADFETAVRWAEAHQRPLYLGEFGAFGAAAMPARERWTRTVVREANEHSLPFASLGAPLGLRRLR